MTDKAGSSVRTTSIGMIVAISGIAAALSVGYPAGAKPAQGHHAQCASKTSKSRAKQVKRRAKCKKPRNSAHGNRRVAQNVGPLVTAPSPTTTAPAPPGTGTTPAPPGPSEAKPLQTPVEAVAQQLLGDLPVPEGAVEVGPEPGFIGVLQIGCRPVVELHRYWRVAGEPRAAIEWIEGRPPAGSRLLGEGSTVIGGVTEWVSAFQFAVTEPGVVQNEQLVFEAIAAEGGGAELRADAQVVPAAAACAPPR
jgi:hypothetical protein